MADYRCSECGEEFEYKAHCVLHNLEEKHEKFELIGTDVNIIIKSK